MEYSKTYIKDIARGCLERYLSLADSLSSLLDPDPAKATKVLVQLISRGLLRLAEYLPLTRTTYLDVYGDRTELFDNYTESVEKDFPPESISLIPLAVADLGLGGWSLTCNYWEYNRPILECSPGKYRMLGVYNYPMYIKYDEDGLITEDSHVFGLSSATETQNQNAIDLEILKGIQMRVNMVRLPMTVEFLNLDMVINELREIVEVDKQTAATLGVVGWR